MIIFLNVPTFGNVIPAKSVSEERNKTFLAFFQDHASVLENMRKNIEKSREISAFVKSQEEQSALSKSNLEKVNQAVRNWDEEMQRWRTNEKERIRNDQKQQPRKLIENNKRSPLMEWYRMLLQATLPGQLHSLYTYLTS